MTMGPSKSLDFASLWTPEKMLAVGIENPVLKVRFLFSGDIHFQTINSPEFEKGMDAKIKEYYKELDTNQAELEELKKTQELKFNRTSNIKEQMQKEYENLSIEKEKLTKRKQDIESRLSTVKRQLVQDEGFLKEEYSKKDDEVKQEIDKLEDEIKEYRDICRRVIDLCNKRAKN
jgi:uncharacterized phage infection (PIP) family protein YhgE